LAEAHQEIARQDVILEEKELLEAAAKEKAAAKVKAAEAAAAKVKAEEAAAANVMAAVKAAEERVKAAKEMAAKSEEMGDSTQVEFDAVNDDIVKRLKLEIDLEVSAQHGHLLDDHQSPVSAEHYSASSPTHTRARGCILISPRTPYPV